MNRRKCKNRHEVTAGVKLKKALRNKRGVTLVELVVTFALISLFVVLSTQVISSAMSVYYKIQSINYGRQVSDTLMDKIAGTIAGAQVSMERVNIENEELNTKYTLQIDDDMSKIDLYNGSGSHIYITNARPDTGGNVQLVIHYYRVESVQEGSNKKLVYEPVDWTFDKKMYLDYKITKLEFSLADPDGRIYPENVIKIDLEIEHKKFGSFSATRYVECYNFQEKDDFAKIKGPGKTESGEESSTPNPPVSGETYPNTDIVITNSYWPTAEELAPLENWASVVIKAGGIFKYTDGNYYIVNKDLVLTKTQAAGGPGGEVYGWFDTQKLTGNIVTFEGEEQRSDLQRGDLCKIGDEYFVFIDGGTYGYSPAVSPGQWYKVP